MFLSEKFNVSAFLGGALFLLTSCSSASFPEITDEDSSDVISSDERKVLKESSSLVSDDKNIAYDDENGVEKVQPVKTTPVIVADAGDTAKKRADIDEDDDDDVDFFGVPFDEDPNAPAKKAKAQKDVKKDIKPEAVAEVKQPEAPQQVMPSVTYLAETFYFDNGGSALPNGAMSRIRQIVKEAKNNRAFVRVMGFASSRTRNTDMASHKMANFKVSQERAEAVAAALRRAGMPANKILVEAMSDSRPAYLEVMPEGERLNRRAEVYISY